MRSSLVVAALLPLFAVACGGEHSTSGRIPVKTISQPTRGVTYSVSSSSMEPTLHCAQPGPGCEATVADLVAVSKPVRNPSHGDVLVCRAPLAAAVQCGLRGTFIKRLIGLPGDTVFEDGHGFIRINGKKLNEPYVQQERRAQDVAEDPVYLNRTWRVPRGKYFLMGDNRGESCDSRQYGSVPAVNARGAGCDDKRMAISFVGSGCTREVWA
jgi:signal peptidase I